MNYFCTLFDSGYLSRGLALYESLGRHIPEDFTLFVLAFDDYTYDILTTLKLENVRVISLDEFEDENLRAVKASRSLGEYCWTCTPSLILYCIEKYQLPHCTYLDADLYFFSHPAPLFEELGKKSVFLTEHRYTPKYDQTQTSGKYCVQFMTFRNDPLGLRALKWWREKCIEWCYARYEDGRFGDQKYLDDWCERFEGVHVMRHIGGGVAPWNVQQYDVAESADHIMLREQGDLKRLPLIFYHFHGLHFLGKRWVYLGPYELSQDVILSIYRPYRGSLKKIHSELSERFDYDISKYTNWRRLLPRSVKYLLRGRLERV